MTRPVLLLLCFALTACGVLSRDRSRGADTERVLPFSAKLVRGDDPRDFTIATETAPKRNVELPEGTEISVETLRESTRFEATKYCLLNFGGSDVDWDIDPQTGDWAVEIAAGRAVFTGRCIAR